MRSLTKGIGLILASAVSLVAQGDPSGRVGRLNYVDGPVSFQPAGINDWVDATINRPLIPGDNLWTGERGRTEVHVGSTALRIGPNTMFEFLNLDDQMVQIRLSEGTLTVRVRSFGQNQGLEIDTPNLAFTPLQPGEYRIDANPDNQTTTITVRNGAGEITGGGEVFSVYARQRVMVRGEDQISYRFGSLPGLDAWDQWCSSRDRREDQSQSARYVSREMAGYEDLDQYGSWSNRPGYGQVWMPNSASAGWAPYRDGHWAWIAPWGWTWVDDAPWGFAPYHYGRWASFGNRWGWIPGPYGVTPVYAPALVAWVGSGGRGSGFSLSFSMGIAEAVAWFPLGPREPYFPSYQASRGYVTRINNTNTVINTTVINNYYDSGRNSGNGPISNIQYVNRNVQNGVTAVPQANFARGRTVNQNARAVSSAQMNSTQVFAAPSIAPQRESVLGAKADTASRAARPSERAMSRGVVARTAPAPAAVPFDRQQPALARNPGQPLATSEVQQIRQAAAPVSAPVRVVDKDRVRRVQPAANAESRVGQPNPAQPAAVERNLPPGQRQQQQEKQQRDAQQQQQRSQQESQRIQQQTQQDVQRQEQQKQQEVQRSRQDAVRSEQQKQRQDVQQSPAKAPDAPRTAQPNQPRVSNPQADPQQPAPAEAKPRQQKGKQRPDTGEKGNK